ncbi:MAG TPA: aliphatic sulfonates ABC transporter substrate-binding protein, partial [Actinobacteria bacterium]|nr:aliphatic sulfonates ABC transporter substrate-binding protein [Actinomycetota bacterium]
MNRRRPPALAGIALAAVASTMLAACASGEGSETASGGATQLNLDYAYWNPLSLAVKDSRCLETA